MRKKVKIGYWEVCCDGMVEAITEDRIQVTDPNAEPINFCIDVGTCLSFCPFCGVKLPDKQNYE